MNVYADSLDNTRNIVDYLLSKIYPVILSIRDELQSAGNIDEECNKLRDVFALCCSQIKKCILSLFYLFRLEKNQSLNLKETRTFILDRIAWCENRLLVIQGFFSSKTLSQDAIKDDSIFITPMYFVNWIDNTFDLLGKLSDVVYKKDVKATEKLSSQWKNEVIDCVSSLHVSLDELLLSAMTLCKYCLPSDQLIIKARSQVVLREAKILFEELVESDNKGTYKTTASSLKLPIMPSNVNILIDVLKDVLYVLETNTNTALLTLLVNCFSYVKSPVETLQKHLLQEMKDNGNCQCVPKSDEEDDCPFVKKFDMYNERLMQIGSFAISCSSDQNRILSLRSGLASLEALDPHLVPALTMSPESYHALLLLKCWKQEVEEIRQSVFLIVDPAAFTEKCKQIIHDKLVQFLKESIYINEEVCSIINIACVLQDFFEVYEINEPQALTHREKLLPLLGDLNRAQKECKTVSNLLATKEDYAYEVKTPTNKNNVTVEQLIKRLKLLYSLINKINDLLHPKEKDQFFELCEDDSVYKNNVTHTINDVKNFETYVNSPRKHKANMQTQSIFGRTINIKSSTRNYPIERLTKHLKAKKTENLSFSVQLDKLFDLSDTEKTQECDKTNIQLTNAYHSPVLYKFKSNINRASLRKALLSKKAQLPVARNLDQDVFNEECFSSKLESVLDDNTSLQVTEILDQLNDMTKLLSTPQRSKAIRTVIPIEHTTQSSTNNNILRMNLNNPSFSNNTVSMHVWNIPVNTNENTSLNRSANTNISDSSQPSSVSTLERLNDLDLVEEKLNNLMNQQETSL